MTCKNQNLTAQSALIMPCMHFSKIERNLSNRKSACAYAVVTHDGIIVHFYFSCSLSIPVSVIVMFPCLLLNDSNHV